MTANESVYRPLSDDVVLRAIVEGVESETGERFFSSLVKHLASAFGSEYAFVSELLGDGLHFRTRAAWGRGKLMENFEIPLTGTPCEPVLRGNCTYHAQDLCKLFPTNPPFLSKWGVESYCGVPLVDSSGAVTGHLAILCEEPMLDGPRGLAIMRIFASRAQAEVERLRAENAIRVSEERLDRVLQSTFDAIVTFDANRKVVLFNHSAENVFRCSASDAIGRAVDPFLCDKLREVIDQAISPSSVLEPRRHSWAFDDVTARRAGGDEFAIEATISQVETESGKLFTLILRDIEERLRAEKEVRELSLEKDYLLEEIKEEHNFEEVVGKSRALIDVIEKVKVVANTDSTVLIIGESGTGKELIARAIHADSGRRNRALVKVNCAGLATSLIDDELFGHEKGAFTGASERRVGRFELAHNGAIFLDEIGDMPAEVQVKMLRVLQERVFERLGTSNPIKVDVRVIAATNRDLLRAVSEGTFRQDLYYRLNVFPIHVPPLRERREDIPALVRYFVRRFAARIGRKITRIRRENMERLFRYSWPGNVRELENVIERSVILSRGSELEIGAGALSESAEVVAGQGSPVRNARKEAQSEVSSTVHSLEATERGLILDALKQKNWRIEGPSGAAEMLKLKPSTLRSRMSKLGIRRSTLAA